MQELSRRLPHLFQDLPDNTKVKNVSLRNVFLDFRVQLRALNDFFQRVPRRDQISAVISRRRGVGLLRRARRAASPLLQDVNSSFAVVEYKSIGFQQRAQNSFNFTAVGLEFLFMDANSIHRENEN